ncbi:MAG: carboxypeptidase regulatory-like domain-containing protein [Deltaproteobacteria bacterium]|nr:carboxypeptidase regulatory-like domain-containing protein [Deltaproteobacteria bacterium]
MKRIAYLTAVAYGLLFPLRLLGLDTGVLAGSVSDSGGAPVEGAMVTATDRSQQRGTTVYADAGGSFRLPALAVGAYDVRVRRIGYRDLQQHYQLGDGAQRLELVVTPESDPHELAWQLPSSRWLPLLLARLSSEEKREEFVRQCTFCHQQGNWATRVPRSAEDWDKIFKLMARMGGIISAELRAELPPAFNAAYDDESYLPALTQPQFVAPAPPRGDAARGVITEWDIGHPASMQHDLAVHPDGAIYSVDTNQDQLYRLDPRTNERKAYAIPRGDSPLGGIFNTTGTLLAPNSNAHVAPHSLQVAPDGSIWVTLCLGNKIGRFDPKTEQWQIIEQQDGLYPHTLRFDRSGRVWYTLAVSNHVGMIDPKTGTRRTIRLPARTWGQALVLRLTPLFLRAARYLPMGDASSAGEGINLPVPYGIDIAPDGGVWFSQLNERRIGRIDPDTGSIKLIDTPFPGPRRLRFDSKGNLWIPAFSAGLLARYALSTGEFKTWRLPIEGVETPYALNVDRRTDNVWICGTSSDSLIRFDPLSEQFTVYPLPTRVTYTREIDFDDAGGVWTSNSNFPTWQIEGPGPKIIRLQPEADTTSNQIEAQVR